MKGRIMECKCKTMLHKDVFVSTIIDFCPLHAASPDLLEALKNLMPITENENLAEEYLEKIEKAQAAIAKAEGK